MDTRTRVRYRRTFLNRLVGSALDQFEALFAPGAAVNLEDAVYPPCCQANGGPLRFRPVRAGGVIVDVRRCDAEPSGDFRLDVLFKTGSCPFGDAVDLARFWNGPLADAFGLPRGPLPERAQQSLLDDLYEALPPAPPAIAPSRPTPVQRKRLPNADVLARRLGSVVRGQGPALAWLSSLVVSQLAKRKPQRPATALLIGPTGVGKTLTIEALPGALAAEGWPGTHLHRIDCNELTDDYDVHRFLGSAPGLVGYSKTPPLVAALRKKGCLVLLDEIDKAHRSVQEALYSLLDAGRIMAPDGSAVRAPGTMVFMTSATGADDLMTRLHRVTPADRRMVDRVARAHLRDERWPPELLSRIDTIAVYQPVENDGLRAAAEAAVHMLAQEYGFRVASLPPVLTDVVLDIAGEADLGVRGVNFAARQLLGETFARATADGVESDVRLEPGPPPVVLPAHADV
jgi:MoxR-like ATPase